MYIRLNFPVCMIAFLRAPAFATFYIVIFVGGSLSNAGNIQNVLPCKAKKIAQYKIIHKNCIHIDNKKWRRRRRQPTGSIYTESARLVRSTVVLSNARMMLFWTFPHKIAHAILPNVKALPSAPDSRLTARKIYSTRMYVRRNSYRLSAARESHCFFSIQPQPLLNYISINSSSLTMAEVWCCHFVVWMRV